MKVLQINSVCGVGSTGRIATDIHDALIKNGHESYIAFGRKKAHNIEQKYTIKIGGYLNVLWHVFMTRVFDNHGFASKRATKKLIKVIDKLNPDIIHLHNLHGYYLNVELLFNYLRSKNKKIFWTLHDCWPFTGHSAYFDYPKIDGWNKGIHNCGGKNNYPKSILLDKSYNNGQFKKKIFSNIDNLTIITPSIWLKNLVDESFLNQYNSIVINNGIDTSIFRKRKTDLREKLELNNKFIILGVANKWEKRKGLEFFLELSKRIDDEKIIILVGVDDSLNRRLPHNIIGIKKTDSISQLAEFYNASDVFINPTLEDNYPTVNLEATACGVPIITFNTGGSPESARFGQHYIVEKSIEKIISVIDELESNLNVKRNVELVDLKIDKNYFTDKILKMYKENL